MPPSGSWSMADSAPLILKLQSNIGNLGNVQLLARHDISGIRKGTDAAGVIHMEVSEDNLFDLLRFNPNLLNSLYTPVLPGHNRIVSGPKAPPMFCLVADDLVTIPATDANLALRMIKHIKRHRNIKRLTHILPQPEVVLLTLKDIRLKKVEPHHESPVLVGSRYHLQHHSVQKDLMILVGASEDTGGSPP